jgi:dTDP-4-amino-4,6-dideoxygalactose transaminase
MREELALHGGRKTALAPFPPWPQFAERTLTDILEPLKNGRVASWSGAKCAEFEQRWAAWAGAPHAIACSSGTAALHMALLACGVRPGDEVIAPSHTFASTSLAILHAGAVPVFCDVAEDQTLSPSAVEPLVTGRTRALVVVHLYGIPCDMERILPAARRHGLRVIEDCAQATGAEVQGRKAGTLGDAGCFSLSMVKHVSTGGEGGMVVTGSDQVAGVCRSLRNYGREQDADGGWAHARVGFNYRLTEMQSIIGLNELARLDSWNLPRRRGFAKIYDHAFSGLYGVRAVPLNSPQRLNAYWKYPLQVEPDRLACGMDELRAALAAEGIPEAGGAWPETYQEPAFADPSGRRCPVAEQLGKRTLVLALHPTWEKAHIETCVAAVKKVLRVYRR